MEQAQSRKKKKAPSLQGGASLRGAGEPWARTNPFLLIINPRSHIVCFGKMFVAIASNTIHGWLLLGGAEAEPNAAGTYIQTN